MAGPTPKQIADIEYVPNAPIRALVEKAIIKNKEMLLTELAQRVGIVQNRTNRTKETIGDCSALNRRIGRSPNKGRPGKPPKKAVYMQYELAVKIVRALDRPPMDYGL